MFSFFKKKSDNAEELYRKILYISRNKLFFNEIGIKDDYQCKIYLILYHAVFIINKLKTKNTDLEIKNFSQNFFDLLFIKIEQDMRELGYGDVTVNKNMKSLIKVFYDILLKCNNYNTLNFENKASFFTKYLQIRNDLKMAKLIEYFDKYDSFCFDLSINSVVKGNFNFK